MMSSPTNQSFLEAMALPALPLTVDRKKVEPEKVLIEKALDTFTAMLHALENHTRIEKPTSTSTAEENLGDYSQDPPEGSAGEVEHIEPVRLRERLVLRSGVPIPMKALRTLHECYKEAEIFINEDLVEHVETGKKLKKIEGKEADGYSEEDYILLRAALTELCQASVTHTRTRNAADSMKCQRAQNQNSDGWLDQSGDKGTGTARAVLCRTGRTKQG